VIIATKIILLLAAVTSGLSAGLFWAFAYSVMPALRTADDRVFVTVMDKINTVIVASGWFWLCYAGGMILSIAALVMVVVTWSPAALPTVIIATAFYLLAMIATGVINIPLNNALAAIAGTADPAVLTSMRQRYEAPWNRGNVIRAALHTIAFVASCIALLRF
jgi:uncharacterized membrane protein